MEKYEAQASKHSRKAAGAARQGHVEKCLRLCSLAAAEGDLMHPSGWDSWAFSSDELFEQAVALISDREIPSLLVARTQNSTQERCRAGWGCLEVFAISPVKLRALALRGVDLAGSPAELPAALRLARARDVEGLAGLMSLGILPPRELDARWVEALGAQTLGRSSLLVLAGSMSWDIEPEQQELTAQVARWLAEGCSIHARDAKGRDALKIALSKGHAHAVQALLMAGSSPKLRDAKGREALEFLDACKQAARLEGRPGLVEAIERCRPAIHRGLERRELDATSSLAPAPLKNRRSL